MLGYVWSLARPLMMFAVLLEVFTHIFRLTGTIRNYPVFLLLDIVLFGFFQEATLTGRGIDRGPRSGGAQDPVPAPGDPALGGVHQPVQPAAEPASWFVFILAFGISPAWTWLLLIPVLLVLFVFTTAVSMISRRCIHATGTC